MFGYMSIYTYYKMIHELKIAGYSLSEIATSIPFELDILLAMYYEDLKEKNKER